MFGPVLGITPEFDDLMTAVGFMTDNNGTSSVIYDVNKTPSIFNKDLCLVCVCGSDAVVDMM